MNALARTAVLGRRRDLRAASRRLAPSGHLDAVAAQRLRPAGAELIAEAPERMIIDLAAVTGLDAAGLAAVTHTALTARRQGIDCRIVPPTSEATRRILSLTGIDRLLDSIGSSR